MRKEFISIYLRVVWRFACVCFVFGCVIGLVGFSAGPAEAAEADEADEQKLTSLYGGNWGVGLGMVIDLGSRERVDDAKVINGIVRVEKDNNFHGSVIMETHLLFNLFSFGSNDEERSLLGKPIKEKGGLGIGPFVAVEVGEDIIDSYGGGLMLGFRNKVAKQDGWTYFNLGVGVMVDPDAKVLGDGIKEGQPLPAGETSIRFREKTQLGLLVVISFSISF